MMDEISDEEAQAAKEVLGLAIVTYYSLVQPDAFVTDWALLVHKDSVDMTRDGKSSVGLLVPTDQAPRPSPSWTRRAKKSMWTKCDGRTSTSRGSRS